MDENLEIPKRTLDQIRSLSDSELAKYLREVSDFGYVKAAMTLRLMVMQKEKTNER